MTDTATATEAPQRETRGFETEAKQLLRLMIHSLYSNKEIFLRELISNAADATNKLRFEALSKPELLGEDSELVIRVETDPANHTVTITDNGIGMSREEVISHLGTIARSGTAEFLKSLTGDQQQDSQLIGQFGVGFYSAFIVADRVEVFTRRAGLSAAEGVYWESVGEADFTVDSVEVPQRGTRIVLHLKPEENEFADDWRLQSIIRKYSDHIGIPVQMKAPPAPKKEDEAADADATPAWQAINKATALWSRPRTELKDEDYQAFYQQLTFDFQPPLAWSHNRVEGKLEYTSLLYVPAHPAFDLWNRDAPRGLKLYVQRTFILDQAEQFLPMYLRFVRGVVDSNDLPLNVSREILQQDDTVTSIRTALTRRVLDMLEKMAQDKPDDYQKFWDGFGQVLKEGPAEDFANREKIASLLRFATTHTNVATQNQTLADYVARMKPDQECIYYIAADNFITAKNSPLLEMFRERGIEVLLLSDRIDDWLMNQLGEVQGKRLQDVARGELQLPGEAEKTEDDKKEAAGEHADVLQRMQTILAEDVAAVRASTRLRESPACLVVGEQDIGMQMRRVLESAGQKVPDSKPVLEINLQHPLLQRLVQEPDEERFAEFTRFVADQATLASGGQLRDPGSFVTRLNRLLVDALK